MTSTLDGTHGDAVNIQVIIPEVQRPVVPIDRYTGRPMEIARVDIPRAQRLVRPPAPAAWGWNDLRSLVGLPPVPQKTKGGCGWC